MELGVHWCDARCIYGFVYVHLLAQLIHEVCSGVGFIRVTHAASMALSMSTRLPSSYMRYAVELGFIGVTHAASMACRQDAREGTLSSGD